jgi:CBS domain-containing protein
MATIKPSASIIVNTDTPIREVIRKMRDLNVGSVLVVSASLPRTLEGIFTERDVLKNIDLIQHGDHWNKPIITVMKKPVTKINLLDLGSAGEVMLKNGIRHLPVVYLDHKKVEHVAGVISMRDLFKHFVEESKDPIEAKNKKTRSKHRNFNIGVITKDEITFEFIEAILKQNEKTAASKVDFKALEDYLEEIRDLPPMDMLVLDLDWVPSNKWGRYVKALIGKTAAPYLAVVYEPTLHETENLNYLKQFEKSPRFAAFVKPIQVVDLLQQLKQWT